MNRILSLEEMGYKTSDILNKKLSTRTTFKNGSIENFKNDMYIYSSGNYQLSENNDGKIEICLLDTDLKIIKSKILNLPTSECRYPYFKSKDTQNVLAEDARLIYHNDLIYCTYTENGNQRICILDCMFNIIKDIKIYYGNNFKDYGYWSGEKNWNLFFNDDKMYFIYSIKDHNIIEVDLDGTVVREYRMDANIPDMYKNYMMHSGSPPKIYDKDHYITFFHTWDKSATALEYSYERPYRISAYLFENKPPFHIKKMTKPLLFGSPNNTDNKLISNTYQVVFSGGMIFKDDYMLVSVGVNDIETKLVKITRDHIIKNIIKHDFKLPTITDMGYKTIEIKNKEMLNRTTFKNGSIEHFKNDTYIYSCGTYIHAANNDGKIEMSILDKNFSIIKNKILDLPKTSPTDLLEDSRLIYNDGLIYCAYTECYEHSQMLAVLDSDLNTIKQIPLYYGNNHKCNVIHNTWYWQCGNWEKNWNFFFNDNKLYFIYSIRDHIVVEIDKNTGEILNEYKMFVDMPYIYNGLEMHSGSPPKIYDKDHYITFFHSWDRNDRRYNRCSRERQYKVSAYLFENKPPFHIKKMTKPLLFGSPQNTIINPDEIESISWGLGGTGNAQTVFSGGMVFKDGYMLVSVGLNDVETKLVKITKEDIEKNIIDHDFYFDMKKYDKTLRYNNFKNNVRSRKFKS